ncbi:unnamed protein product [Rotaria sp. Silwood1]|nr:unnamed protein product [Rotaria sp. Silwood1]CAF1592553.1 unnamed protein product [Rotaria sp. Silwood1]CAF3729618.1 unnamed protein product [Rotaria sp. Silwood1]CAF4915190.1 unnamed protein product [Rotaria sp. Silwood1]
MLTTSSSNNDGNDSNIIDLFYDLYQENEIEKIRSILPYINNIRIINKIQNSIGSTCLHVACFYEHRHMVPILLEYGALHSIKSLQHNLTPYEDAYIDGIKQMFVEHRKLFSNNNCDFDCIEWSVLGDDLLEKRREFRQAIDLYKTYDNHHLVSKLLLEVIHYYLNEYLTNEINDIGTPEDQITRKQIETIETYFKEAMEKQDYLTYFIKTNIVTNIFCKVLNQHLALYILQYIDKTKDFSSNYRLVNCLVHIVTLLIYRLNLPQYRYQGFCYQGIRITQYDLDQYLSNKHILNRSFLSTSMNCDVAEMFAGEDQQSKMRHTSKDHGTLQYSCLCKYLIKQNSTAINIKSLSTSSDNKEILILPFTVFKVIAIKQNYLDDPSASISIEIVLEECEDSNDNKNESKNSETLRKSSLSQTNDGIKDVDKCRKVKQRKRLLYGIIGFLVWNARSYKSRENLTTFPVTDIVVHQLGSIYSIMNHQSCIKEIKKVQDYQMDKQKWDDIGYNFLLCDDSGDQQQIYTGRGWNFTGAHCKGYNAKSLGIVIIGNYTSTKSLKAFKSLIQCGIMKNAIMNNFTLVGHFNSRKIYEYYLQYFKSDTDLQYSNQASKKQFICTGQEKMPY